MLEDARLVRLFRQLPLLLHPLRHRS